MEISTSSPEPSPVWMVSAFTITTVYAMLARVRHLVQQNDCTVAGNRMAAAPAVVFARPRLRLGALRLAVRSWLGDPRRRRRLLHGHGSGPEKNRFPSTTRRPD